MFRLFLLASVIVFLVQNLAAQGIGSFTGIAPASQDALFHFPSSHSFQVMFEEGDWTYEGCTIPDRFDFTGFVPINGSSETGYLSLNSESTPGGNTVFDIGLNTSQQKWSVFYSQKIDFVPVGGTARNCSGTVTPWQTVISCEETTSGDGNGDGYNDLGWAIEIDPYSKKVIDKLWAMGNFSHENVVIHSNQRVVYQGADSNPGYLYKFIADVPGELSSGDLYVYKGSKSGVGVWIKLSNTTQEERNSTLAQSDLVNATVFNGIEDVEIGPDGLIYFAVKGECVVYRFEDPSPLLDTSVMNFQVFVGGCSQDYDVNHEGGTTNVAWGTGNDNLAFDDNGNLWVLQDGSDNHIWVVGPDHLPENSNVRIFGRSPAGSEPTGISFTPDFKYLFMSFQHPSSTNDSVLQVDAFGNLQSFDKDVAIVISRSENLGPLEMCPSAGSICSDGNATTYNDTDDGNCNCLGITSIVDSVYIPIVSGDDDVEEDGLNGTMYLNSSDIELVSDEGNNNSLSNQLIGLRFRNLPVPPRAKILKSYILFTVDEVDSVSTSLIIRGEQTGHSVSFTDSIHNISSRNTTTSQVQWEPASWLEIGASNSNQKSPDLNSIVQEIIDHPNFNRGNAISFVFSGVGERTAESFEGCSHCSATLFIKYLPDSCQDFLQVSIDPILTGSYQAQVELQSSKTIQSNMDVYFAAGENVLLNPGFEVANNGMFIANIATCK